MKSKLTKERVHKFLSYYKPHRRIFIMDMIFAGISAVSVLLFPLVSGYMTREVLGEWTDESWTKLMSAVVILILILALKMISNIIYGYFGHAMAAKMEETMRKELFQHYETLSFDFHAKNSIGKLLTVLSNDSTNMTELFHHGPEDLLMTVIKFIGAFAIMFHIHAKLTLIVFCTLPFLGVAAYYANKKMEQYLLKNKGDLSYLNEFAEDTLAGIRTVKAFGKEKIHLEDFDQRNREYTDSRCLFYKVEAFFYEVMRSFPQFLSMMIVIFGALFITKGSLDAAILVTFLLYAGTLAEPIGTMLNFINLYENGKSSFIRFMDMIELCPTITEKEDAVTLQDAKGEITFQNVSFAYDATQKNILEDVSFRIHSGSSVAFAGASGIGKTTIASLIARFYDITRGEIKIDGIDIRDISIRSLRDTIGIVQQEVYIFNGTIRDNIKYGKENATDDEIINAAKMANIHDFIVSLENGYDSFVGTKGIMLSGGQRQRISIARLFLKNPKILILDEATSALDYESEEIVQKSIERLKKDRTSIVIAHRLSTIKDSDVIFVLSDKRITEQGSHDSLIEQNGEYARLCKIGICI